MALQIRTEQALRFILLIMITTYGFFYGTIEKYCIRNNTVDS